MKKFKYLLLIVILFGFCIIPVFASTNTFTRTEDNLLVSPDITVTSQNLDNILGTPAVDASEKVYDFAELLTPSEEEQIYNRVQKFINKTNLDLAVVTINDNNKFSAMEYADDFYDYNDFGTDSEYSGVLFLVDMDTREIYMSTTGKAISMYSDYRIDMTLDAIYQDFSNENYLNGITKFVAIIENYDTIGLPSNKDSKYAINNEGEVYRKFPWLIVFGIPSVITAIVIGILISKNKLVRVATSSREYLDKDSLQIKTVSDRLVSTNTIAVPRSSGSSSGGGGSSRHSGSSGRSHGGGGHRF